MMLHRTVKTPCAPPPIAPVWGRPIKPAGRRIALPRRRRTVQELYEAGQVMN